MEQPSGAVAISRQSASKEQAKEVWTTFYVVG